MFKKISDKKANKLYKEFLSEALEIVEKPASPLGHFTIWIIIIIILSVILWSVYGYVDKTANARGKVVTTDGTKIVQAVNAGVVQKIFVTDGDKVNQGDKLLLLDSELVEESLDYSKNNVLLLKYKIDLLSMVQKDEDISSYFINAKNKDELKIAEYAMSLEAERRAIIDQYTMEVEKSVKRLQIEEKNYDILLENEKSLKKEKARLEKICVEDSVEKLKTDQIMVKIVDLEQEVKTYETLYKNDAITKEELDKKIKELENTIEEKDIQQKLSKDTIEIQKKNLEDNIAQIDENNARKETQKATIDFEVKNVEASKEALRDAKIKSNASIAEIIVELNAQLDELNLNLKQQNLNYEHQIITAPITGTIQDIGVNTIGGVVTQAQALIEIIPAKSKLIIEADLENKDIGYVKLGQQVSIKMDTYNYQEYGMLNGKVIEISPDAVEDERKGRIYKVKVDVDTEAFTVKYKENQIVTGMECRVEIKTGKRRIISFFLEPIMKHLDESLKVR